MAAKAGPDNAERLARGVRELARPLADAHRADGPESFFNAEHHTGIPDFLLSFAGRGAHPVVDDLREPRGHRAIGVVYDAFMYLEETRAVPPLHMRVDGEPPETYPSGV